MSVGQAQSSRLFVPHLGSEGQGLPEAQREELLLDLRYGLIDKTIAGPGCDLVAECSPHMCEVPGSTFTPRRKTISFIFCLSGKLSCVLWLPPRPFTPSPVGLTPLLAISDCHSLHRSSSHTKGLEVQPLHGDTAAGRAELIHGESHHPGASYAKKQQCASIQRNPRACGYLSPCTGH